MEEFEVVVINKNVIETPDSTSAKYVYTDYMGNRVYYDGSAYWCVDGNNNNKIEYYNY